MDTRIMKNSLTEKESFPFALEQIFSDMPTNAQQLENRWKSGFNTIFSYMTKSVSVFLLSKKNTEVIAEIRSFIRRLFCKTDYIEKIKNDYEQQNVFLLGYLHGIYQLIDSFESETSYRENSTLREAVSTYKHVTPVLRILDAEIELSHNKLAEKVGMTPSALSNLMKNVKKYELFNYTKMGKNKYYSLAYPNGKEALKLAEEDNGEDKYTQLLLDMMDSLIRISTCDEVGKEDVLKKCEKMFMQYTTNPALCKEKLEHLALISKSERIYCRTLIIYEKHAKKINIFTKDPLSEKIFLKTINRNLQNDAQYHWFFAETKEFNSAEKIKKIFLKQLSEGEDFDNIKREKFKANIQCHIVPANDVSDLFGDIYDAVIYDEKAGFSCVDETIDVKTPYLRMSQDTFDKFNQYAQNEIRA